MQISENGLKIIEQFEGLYLKAYQCQAKRWTIGYGTVKYPNGDKVSKGDTCTHEQADRWLRFEAVEKCACLDQTIKRVGISFNQNEFDAVASFIYNLGEGMLGIDRSFGIALRTGNRQKMAESMALYCQYRNSFGIMRVSKGLLARRKAERALFLLPC